HRVQVDAERPRRIEDRNPGLEPAPPSGGREDDLGARRARCPAGHAPVLLLRPDASRIAAAAASARRLILGRLPAGRSAAGWPPPSITLSGAGAPGPLGPRV